MANEKLAALRERLRGEPAFRDRLMNELVLVLGLETGILSEDGAFVSDESQRVVEATDPMVGGRPLLHYMGLDATTIRAMGVDDAGIRTLQSYIVVPGVGMASAGPVAAEEEGETPPAHPNAGDWTPPTDDELAKLQDERDAQIAKDQEAGRLREEAEAQAQADAQAKQTNGAADPK